MSLRWPLSIVFLPLSLCCCCCCCCMLDVYSVDEIGSPYYVGNVPDMTVRARKRANKLSNLTHMAPPHEKGCIRRLIRLLHAANSVAASRVAWISTQAKETAPEEFCRETFVVRYGNGECNSTLAVAFYWLNNILSCLYYKTRYRFSFSKT